MNNYPIKAASKDYKKESFYLIQNNGNYKRYVVSLIDKIRIRTLFAGFINQANDNVQLKIRDLNDKENPIDFSGECNKSKLHQLMTKYENVIFHNGFHEFMIRIIETGDYIAFDDHGLVFIYTNEDYQELLNNLEAEHRPNEKLIYEFDHWYVSHPEGRELLTAFISDIGLEKE